MTDSEVEEAAKALAEYDGYDWSTIRELPRHGNDEAWCKDDYSRRARVALTILDVDVTKV
jgi:hypothetical protein